MNFYLYRSRESAPPAVIEDRLFLHDPVFQKFWQQP